MPADQPPTPTTGSLSASRANAARGAASERELTLDPEDWDTMRALGHRMVDDVMSMLQHVRGDPAWRPVPADVAERLRLPVPRSGQRAEHAYADFRDLVLPYRTGNIHPRFWGRVMGTGTALGALTGMLTAALNDNVSTIDSAASHVEGQVLAWCREIMGFPAGASGVMVSGCSTANLIGLAVARDVRAGFDVHARGLAGGPAMTVYCSEETHNSVHRAVAVLGLGMDAVRRITTDHNCEIRLDELEDAITRDLAAGLRPFCIVGNAGTVGTGAIDNLSALAAIARERGLWFHVDGAFGAVAALSPTLRQRLAGMEQADSLAFDFHKWLHVPYSAAAVLVRNQAAHRRTFASSSAAYLGLAERGAEADPFRWNELGVELSREARAVGVWMLLKEHGTELLGRLVEQNVAQARYLADLVRANPNLQLLAPVALNIVCFRYARAGVPSDAMDAVNSEILARLQESGVAVPTRTRIGNRFGIRVAITNHRSVRADFELLVESVIALGSSVVQEHREHREHRERTERS
ncbi:MAG: pyridoxal phosphate-dependent decarboxylase family protein [Gemmatimonadaceae bacterium]